MCVLGVGGEQDASGLILETCLYSVGQYVTVSLVFIASILSLFHLWLFLLILFFCHCFNPLTPRTFYVFE